MRRTFINDTDIMQTYYDEYRRPYKLDPGESVTVDTDNTYEGFENLTLLQAAVGGVSYVGYAKPGTTVTQPGWAIAQVDANGNKRWAGSDFNFGFIWNDRLTYSYG